MGKGEKDTVERGNRGKKVKGEEEREKDRGEGRREGAEEGDERIGAGGERERE